MHGGMRVSRRLRWKEKRGKVSIGGVESRKEFDSQNVGIGGTVY